LIVRAGLCLSIIVSGLALRGYGLALGRDREYGGSALWAAMLFSLVAMSARGWSRRSIGLIAASIAVSVELLRLVHTPWLDAFRLTLPGALLLGRIFSQWDILAYGVGIGLGSLLDRLAR
jgi:Protein of unknown function (DUF2809)